MKKYIIFYLAALLFSAVEALAQFNETIVSDRPGQSNSPYTAGKMVLQFQSGPQYGGGRTDNYDVNNFSWPLFVRFGITDKIEVQTHWGYLNNTAKIFDRKQTNSGIDVANFGLRFNIFEETEKAPALGFEFSYKTRMTTGDFRSEYPSARFNIMATKGLTDLLSLTSNLGADFNGDSGQPDGFYTLNVAFAATDELSLFFENYGNFNGDYFHTFFDFGGAYILSSDLQLDLYGGFGYNDDTFSFLVSGGVSYRITKWRKE